MRGMIIQSGNDACVVLAEGLAGSTEAFVEQMNATARRSASTTRISPMSTACPIPKEYTTAHDLATLADHTHRRFSRALSLRAEKDFTYNGIKQGNRNPLLYKNLGVDGIKTGHTEEAGYGLDGLGAARRPPHRHGAGGHANNEGALRRERKAARMGVSRIQRLSSVRAGEPSTTRRSGSATRPRCRLTTAKDMVVTLPRKARPAHEGDRGL